MSVGVQKPMTQEKIETMMGQEPSRESPRTWKPGTAGVLAILSGYANVFTGIVLWAGYAMGTFTLASMGVGIFVGILAIVLGVLSIIGGAYAISRRSFGAALMGAIASSLLPSVAMLPGVLSLIWVAQSRDEFKRK
jgi:ABC-type glycerol-3-phosphate transport system permease component